jgi:hypothetical protein
MTACTLQTSRHQRPPAYFLFVIPQRSEGICFFCCLFFLFVSSLPLSAQSPAPLQIPQISFDFTRPGLPTPKFTLTLSADGTGTYAGQEVPTPSRYSNVPSAPRPFERTLTLSQATTKKIFDLAAATPFSDSLCASKARNIADTGAKIIAYTSAGERRSCTYNYTDRKDVAALTTLFLNLAETMDEGRRLEFMHRFDRLGLDAELISYTRQLDEGNAMEPGMIAPTLHSLVDDAALLQRVRMRAAALLAKISPTP